MLAKTVSDSEIKDLIYRIDAFNKDKWAYQLLEQRQEELLYELEEKQLIREKEAIWREKTAAEHLVSFVSEFYKTAVNLPEHIKKETGGSCTVFDFFKIMVKDSIHCFVDISKILAKHISVMLELGVSIPDIAEKVNADPDDLSAFHKKYA